MSRTMQPSTIRWHWNPFLRCVCFACAFCVLMTLTQTARAAFVLASVNGVLPSISGQDTVSSEVLASISTSLSRSGVNGSWNGSAVAGYGQLGSAAEVTAIAVPGSFGISQSVSQARFGDTWIFTDQSLDTVGQMRVSVHFDGAAFQTPDTTSFVTSYGRLDLSLNSADASGGVFQSGGVYTGEITGAVDTTYVSDPLMFLYGRPILVGGVLFASVQISRQPDSSFYSGSGLAQFGNTAALTLVEVLDANGNWTSAFSLNTQSNARYPFSPTGPSTVPTPSTFVMLSMLFGMLGVAWSRKRWKLNSTAA